MIPNASFPRSSEATRLAVLRRDPENAPFYHRRDLTGDGIPETMCNWFARDFCADMSCPIPNAKAGDQIKWLGSTLGHLDGWRKAGRIDAAAAAARGEVVLVTWLNPNEKQSSHIAVMVDGDGNIAQAGRTNFNKGTIVKGFGDLPVCFFIHS